MTVYPRQIYIVDDDLSFGRALKRLLNARGLAADYFTSAQSFFDTIPANRQGFVILDIQMPECDGFTLLDKLHQLHYDLPAIVVTGQTRPCARELALEKGAVGFLLKPFTEDSLLAALTKAAESAGDPQCRRSI